jgi:hypothetical protein
LLVSGAYHRAGPDLVLTSPDGRHFIVPGYFSSEHPPALVAPNGMTLSGDMVQMLAGSPTPGEYAQAQPGMPADGIGKIEKVVGDVTAVRNGVAVTLHVGDAVFKSDVIRTGAGSSVGISFPDGTALNLVANTRMGLNDYNYNPSSNSNDALFTLVEGTFAFVAGKVAHTGDMKIGTPVATMGIRGTTGVVEEEVATVSATQNGVTYSFSVVADFGTGVAGMYDLIDQAGNVIATVSQTGYVTYLTPQGVNQSPLVSVAPVTNSQFAVEQDILQQLFQAVTPVQQQQQQQTTPGNSTPPPPNPNPIIQLLQNGNSTTTVASSGGGTTAAPPPPIILTVTVNPPPPPQITPTATQNVSWIGGSSGNWNVANNWSDDVVPTSFSAIEILTAATIFVTDSETANGLTVGPGATLDLVSGGSVTLANSVTGLGTAELDGTGGDPTLAISGTVFLLGPDPTVAAGGEILLNGPAANNLIMGVAGTGAELVNVQDTIIGSGTIGQGDGNLTLVNGVEGTINATGLLIIDTGNLVANSGLMEATAGGTLQIEDSVSNIGTVEASGADALVTMANAAFDNFGTVSAQDQGAISFSGVTFTNESTGSVNAAGGTITVDGGTVSNAGTISTGTAGTLQIEDVTVTNSDSGEVSIGANSTLDLEAAAILGGTVLNAGDVTVTGTSAIQGDTVTNAGDITVGENASLTLEGSTSFSNATGAEIDANGGAITVNVDASADVNDGTIEAQSGGSVTININEDGSSNHGLIEAVGDGSSITFGQNNHEQAAQGGGGGSGGNYGTVEATGGGVVTFNTGLDNYDLVEAAAGGAVDFTDDNHNHSGGTIESTGANSLVDFGNGSLDNSDLIIAENGGSITFASVTLTNENGATLESTGTGSSISWNTGGVTNDSGGIIEADTAGSITFDGSIGIMNEGGTIEALSGGSILFETTGTGSVSNDGGTIKASGAGSSVTFASSLNGAQNDDGGVIEGLNGGIVTIDGFGENGLANSGGFIEANGTNAAVELVSATINGGTLETSGGGVIETTVGNSTFLGVTIANGGDVVVTPDTSLTLQGTTTIDGTVEFEGPGTVKLDFTSYKIVAGVGGATFHENTTVEGAGTIGNGDSTLILDIGPSGTIDADISGQQFVVDTGATDTNMGTLEATNGGTLVLDDNVTNETGSIIKANDAVATVDLNDGYTNNGTIETANGGIVNITGLDGDTVNYGLIEAVDGTINLNITGYGINDGTIEAGAGGTIVWNRIATVSNPVGGNHNLVEAVDGGSITYSGSGGNYGTTEASGSGSSITYNLAEGASSQFNSGVMEALAGGTITFNGGTVNNSGGTIEASGTGSIVKLVGATVTSGTLETGSGGVIETPSGTSTLDGVSIAGGSVLEAATGSVIDLEDTTTLNGTVALEGSGTFVLDPGEAKIVGGASGGTLDNEGTLVTVSSKVARTSAMSLRPAIPMSSPATSPTTSSKTAWCRGPWSGSSAARPRWRTPPTRSRSATQRHSPPRRRASFISASTTTTSPTIRATGAPAYRSARPTQSPIQASPSWRREPL